MNNNIYGAFQGIGPTSSRASKLLIAHIINNCQKFIVRDYESYEKLLQWGARLGKVIPSSDPAILPRPQPLNNELKKKLQKDFQIDEAFLKNFVSFSPRSWFHYKPGGILPFRYKKALLRIIGQKLVVKEDRFILYRSQLVSMADLIISEHNMNILLVPMHMSEDDVELCNYIKKHARESKKIRILAKDTLSPTETRSLIARAKVAVGFRLHSTIISTSCGVPSLNIYYVDKGRVFFDQIKQSYYALPIEKVLDKNFISQFSSLFTELEQNRQKIKKDLEAQITSLRDSIEAVFREIP